MNEDLTVKQAIEAKTKAVRHLAEAVKHAMDTYHTETGAHITGIGLTILINESFRTVNETMLSDVVVTTTAGDTL